MGLTPTTSAPLTCYAGCEKSEKHPEEQNGRSATAFSTTRGTTLIFLVSFFVCLLVGFRPTRECVTHMEAPPIPASNTHGH